ncbi:MAG: M20/M25/M40 family metallo-hydrolase [Bacteroidota bacterium]|nr:M20/M25/M40 family metallo-hydrolase [Bacteroidota bacterium]
MPVDRISHPPHVHGSTAWLPAIAAVLFFLQCAPAAQAQSLPQAYSGDVAEIIGRVSQDTLMRRVRELCGVDAITVDGIPLHITNRKDGFGSEGNDLAADYLAAVLTRYGLGTHSQRFEDRGRNIIGVQHGSGGAGGKYIICAHYDAAVFGFPGADDNASGTAAVLEAARLLSTRDLAYTVEYILWDAEERGLVGSRHYAERARANGDSILGVINLDMISWDSDGDDRASLEYNNESGLPLVNALLAVNDSYGIGLDFYTRKRTSTPSDNFSFTQFGFPSMLLIEDWTDFNRYYHGINDAPTEMNVPYYARMAKTAIGALALLTARSPSDTKTAAPQAEIALHTPSPHPFSGIATVRFTLPHAQHVRIELFDMVGRLVKTVADIEGRSGAQQVLFDASSLSPGSYVLRMTTASAMLHLPVLRSR